MVGLLGVRYVGLRRGERTTTDRVEVYVRDGAHEKRLPLRLDLFSHSPDGFNWGYAGSGPAQLALAVLADALKDTPLGDQTAIALHQKFKHEVFSKIEPGRDWGMGKEYVIEWVTAQQQEKKETEEK